MIILIQAFIHPIQKEFSKDAQVKSTFSDGVIETIYNLHLELLEKMQSAFEQDQSICTFFVSQLEAMRQAYTTYCEKETSYLEQITNFRQKLDGFNLLLGRCSLIPETRNLSLEDLWIKPLGRFFRYPALFGELQKHAPSYAEIHIAAENTRRHANALGKYRARHENWEKLIGVQNQIEDGRVLLPLKAQRIFIRDGILGVTNSPEEVTSSSVGIPQRRCILLSDHLIILPRAQSKSKVLHLIGKYFRIFESERIFVLSNHLSKSNCFLLSFLKILM